MHNEPTVIQATFDAAALSPGSTVLVSSCPNAYLSWPLLWECCTSLCSEFISVRAAPRARHEVIGSTTAWYPEACRTRSGGVNVSGVTFQGLIGTHTLNICILIQFARCDNVGSLLTMIYLYIFRSATTATATLCFSLPIELLLLLLALMLQTMSQ